MYSIININKAQNWKQKQSHFLFGINLLSYSTITRAEGKKIIQTDWKTNTRKAKFLSVSVSGNKELKLLGNV